VCKSRAVNGAKREGSRVDGEASRREDLTA